MAYPQSPAGRQPSCGAGLRSGGRPGAISRLRRCEYGKRYQVDEGVELRFTGVGHLLGSAAVELWLHRRGRAEKIVFSRRAAGSSPILKDPETVDEGDYLVIESTYGNRLHEITGALDTVGELADVLQHL